MRRQRRSETPVWAAHGYRLIVDRGDVDARRFEDLAERGRHALYDGDVDSARELLAACDHLWRGPAASPAQVRLTTRLRLSGSA